MGSRPRLWVVFVRLTAVLEVDRDASLCLARTRLKYDGRIRLVGQRDASWSDKSSTAQIPVGSPYKVSGKPGTKPETDEFRIEDSLGIAFCRAAPAEWGLSR